MPPSWTGREAATTIGGGSEGSLGDDFTQNTPFFQLKPQEWKWALLQNSSWGLMFFWCFSKRKKGVDFVTEE